MTMFKVTEALVKDVVEEIGGAEAVELVTLLKKNRKKVSEFKLAAMAEMDIKTVRNLLYKMFHVSLVSYTRKKDKQKGWYIYSWFFNRGRVGDLYISLKRQKLDKLRQRIDKEKSTNFYMCKNMCVRIDFEHAVDFNFKCPECGELLNMIENQKTIENLDAQIAELEKELKKIGK